MPAIRGSSTAAPAHTAATSMATQTARRPADLAAPAGPGPGRGSGASGKSTPSAARTLRTVPSAGSDAPPTGLDEGPGCADGSPGFCRPVPSVILASQARRHGTARIPPTCQQEPATPKALSVVSNHYERVMASQAWSHGGQRRVSGTTWTAG